jgi:beta-phosphoglucomutase
MKQNFAVIFDMDGVLVDNASYHVQAWKQFLQSHGIHFQDDMKTKIFGATNKEHLELFFDRSLSEREIYEFELQKEQIYRNLYFSEIKPVKGLISFLELLERNNIPIAMATSGPRVNIDFVIDRTSTTRFFSQIFDASSVSKGKPDPEIYLKTIDSLGMSPQNCIVIEDSINGILAAKSAGAKVIGITTTHKADELPPLNLIIDDFDQLTISSLENLFNFAEK